MSTSSQNDPAQEPEYTSLSAQQRAELAELRAAALTVLRRPNRLTPEVALTSPVRWRVIVGHSESLDSIAPVCPAINDINGLHFMADSSDGPVFNEAGAYDCCPGPWIGVGLNEIAAYLVALLNADAEAEADRLAERVTELEAKRGKLVRWHEEDARQMKVWGRRVARAQRDVAAARVAGLLEAAEIVDNDDDCGGCDTCIPRALAAEIRDRAASLAAQDGAS